MAGKGRSNLGEFNFVGSGDGDHEGSVAFSDISFPSHVSDLESFHSDLDISVNSRASLFPDDDGGFQVEQHEDDTVAMKENIGGLPDLPENVSENVDVLLAALKAAAMQDSSSDRASIDTNKSRNSTNSNLDSSRFISKESFPESVLAEASQSWVREASRSAHSIDDTPEEPSPVVGGEKCETSVVKPGSDSRLSEKFLAPSKTPDNGRTERGGCDKSDRSPWSFSGDSLLFQTPRAVHDTSSAAKNDTLSQPSTQARAKPSSSSTPVETSQSLNQSKQLQSSRASVTNDTFPPQQNRLSDIDFGADTYNPFDGSYHGAGFNNDLSTKPSSSKTKAKPSSSSTPLEDDDSTKYKQASNRASISNDTFPPGQDSIKDDIDSSKAAYNPFDQSHTGSFSENELGDRKSLFGDGDALFGDNFDGGFSFQSAGDAAKRLDEDEKIFEESHRFDKEDAMVNVTGQCHSFSYYVLPGDARRSLSVVGVNDPNDKGEVRISFGEFFAAKTEELGRLGDGDENRPRPQFSDTRTENDVSPVAVPPRALYRPSSPEGSEKGASYQPSFIDLEKTEQKSNRTRTLRERNPAAMVARSSPYGAEADGDDGRAGEKEKSDAVKDGDKKKDDKKSSKGSSKSRQSTVETAEGDADVKRDSGKNSGGLELNNSTLAALKYCNSSEGSKLSEMSSKELKSLSKTLARANIDDAQEIYNVLVNFINNKIIASKDVTEASQRLSDVFESTGRKVSSRKDGEPQEGDAMTFYHSDTSCEVSPTDPKFRTMSSISSPPLDSSSPKSSGSSIGVQTDSNVVSVIPTTLTTVASSEGKGSPVRSNNLARSSTQVTGQYGVSEQITPASNLTPPTQYGSIPVSVQTAGATSTSPVLSAEYVTITSRTTPTGHPNTIPPTSRTLTSEEQNNPPSRPYRSQSTTSSVPNQRHIYGADNRPFGFPESQIVHHLGRATYPPGGPRHPGYETALMATTDVPRQMYQVGQPYHQTTKTDQLDPTTRRPVARSSHSMAASIQAAAASWNVIPTQSHDVFLPGHANTEGGRHLVRTEHANIDPAHVNPLSNNAVRVPGYIPPQSNDPNFATSHGIPIQSHEIPDQGHAFRRNDRGISDPKHGVALSSQAVFKPLQSGQPNDAIPASRQGTSSYPVPHTGGNILAQSCPAFTARQLASPDLHPGCSVQSSACRPPERTRTMSSNQTTAYHIPSKTTAMPHGAQTAFNYQDVGPEQFHVVSDVYNECGRRPRDRVASGQRQGEVWTRRTERTSQIQMVIPPALDFPGVLCVGTSAEADLSVYNPTSRWIRCSSEIVSCSVNGLKVDNKECPFSIRGKTMLGPKLTENIKVDFKCLSAGVYVADMKVISTPVASVSGEMEMSSAFVSLQGFAEEPKLEIVVDELRTLDFGEVHHGCNGVRPLKIVNKGMTAVPLEMRISSDSSPGIFVFSKTNSSDVIPRLELQSTTLKCLVPATNDLGLKAEPLVIWIELSGKNYHCYEKSDDAQVLSAGINIQLESETVAKTLGNVQLAAVMGFTKIQIPKAFQMAMCLSSPVGKRVSREFPFTNAGNICANVELTIPKHLDVFSVTPDKFQVRPGMAVMVKVMFTPVVNDTCESVIQVSEPDSNKCYEVLLRGSAVEPQTEMNDGPPILSNKSWLCWTGVDLGNATHQRLFLLNDSADHSIHFQVMILGEHSDFEIQRVRSEFSKGGTSSEKMVLRPKERMPIYVLFSPSSFGIFKSALVLKPDHGPRFQVPLYAYGGRSFLSFSDLKKTSEGYDAQLGEVSLGRRNILKITAKNTGRRAAFVKAVCYADFQIRLHYQQTHLSIVPSEFVLPERSSKELVVVYQPLQHDAKACLLEMKRVATIVFYHGDEVLRQWYRRNTTKRHEFDGRRTNEHLKYDEIRFDKVFQEENCAAEDFDFPDLENYEQIFDSHISQTFLNLLGGSEKDTIQSNMGEETMVMATPRRRHVEPEIEKDLEAKSDKVAEMKENPDKDENTAWSLIPEQLSLKVPVQGSHDSTKKVQLLNFSDRHLEFELIWPAHCVAVTPHTGTIAPKSQTTINISAWGSILKSGVDLPWSGTAYVRCDGAKKAIAIQIHNLLVSEDSPAPSVIDKPLPIAKVNNLQRLPQAYTAFVKPVKQTHLLKVTPTLVDFDQVEVNKASYSTVTIENMSTSSLRWKISSFAPAYAKISHTSSELLRATYPVFSFSLQSGFIRPNQVIKIQVEFRARDAGDYCQIWDCQTNPESPLTTTKVKLELSGKALVKEAFSGVSGKDKNNVPKKNPALPTMRESLTELPSKETNEAPKGKSSVYFQSDNVEFPGTDVGQTSTVKVKICNKSTADQQFRIITPSAPFYMKCTSLVAKPSHYLKIPVYFSPQETGKHYDALIKFENIKTGETLTVKLRANSL